MSIRGKIALATLMGVCMTLSGCGSGKLEFLDDNDSIVAGDSYIAALEDGNVLVACDADMYNREIMETEWSNAVRLIKNFEAPAGISADGTILPAKGESVEELAQKMQETLEEIMEAKGNVGATFGMEVDIAKEMMQWGNLQQVYGSYPYFGGFGLRKDGVILQTEINLFELAETDITTIQSWENIQDLALAYYGSYVAGLNSDGVVSTVNFEDISWTNIQSIESGKIMLFGLTEEGTVLHSDPGFEREYSTEAMKDIVFIAAGYDNEENIDVVYGITKEGKVVDRLGVELEGFEDIVEIDVTTMSPIVVVGRKADGTICISENADEAMKQAVAKWNEGDK